MSTIYDAHFKALHHDLALFPDGRGRAAAKLAEVRLAVAWRYRRQLPLKDPAVTTIPYCRWFWPRIESEVKYQELRYTLSLRPPKGKASTVHNAVLEEAGRRARHIALNPSLYKYILQARRDRDRLLFDGDPAKAHTYSEGLAACYYALKFSPTEPLHERQDFLLRELGRRDRTIAESPDLYNYIESNRTDLDQSLFASDHDLASTYATTIATLLALDRYHAYLQTEFSD
jgi:hypothetical protein